MGKRVLHEVLVRAYSISLFRKLVSPFVKVKEPEKWIFLIGCYNSGTTLLRDLLGSHSAIATLPREGVRFTNELPRPEVFGWVRMWLGCIKKMKMEGIYDESVAYKIRKDWSPWWEKGSTVYLEKSISNLPRVVWLDRHFKNAYFIYIVRDGYCVCEGISRRAKPAGEVVSIVGETYPMHMIGEQWRVANQLIIDGAHSLQRYYSMRYEDLVEDPIGKLTEIFRFAGIESPEMSIAEGALCINGVEFNLVNMNAASYARLSVSDYSELNPVIGDMMAQLGYEERYGNSVAESMK